ncbi:hypothetical protein [Deinococcus yunweiensis]|uniref:hypothetical protein n=1 Tax=Deinococcus yunweiensis TaxID=367282 RepID=UPI00398EB30D
MTQQSIKGLTLTHPWAWCIAHAGKDVENRRWRPERQGGQVGMYLAIHGGAVPGKNTGKREEARMDLAAALRTMLLLDQAFPFTDHQISALSMGRYVPGEEDYFVPGIVAVARLTGVSETDTSPWSMFGQYHWQLADLLTLSEPIPHRGAQGLWTIEPDALEQLRAAWKGRAA